MLPFTMRRNLFLLVGVIVLYLAPSFVLSVIYGPSYGFLVGEDCWKPDGAGGWRQHGDPTEPPPDEPSIEVPLTAQYLPIFLPGMLLIAVLFTPLSQRFVDSPPERVEPPPSPE